MNISIVRKAMRAKTMMRGASSAASANCSTTLTDPEREPELAECTTLISYLGPSPFVEVEGLIVEPTDGPLRITVEPSEAVDLWFVQGEGRPTTVFVSRDGEPSGQLEVHAGVLRYTTSVATPLGLELAAPGQEARTTPTIVLVPIEKAPESP